MILYPGVYAGVFFRQAVRAGVPHDGTDDGWKRWTVKTRKIQVLGRRDAVAWLIMLPSIILFAFFVWEPLLENIRLSFSTAKMYTVTGFAGFDNYRAVLSDVDFKAAFGNFI